MDEFSFIDCIQPEFYYQSGVQKGIGDDAAVLRIGEKDLVTATDTFVEGVHFTRETMDLDTVGYRVLAANLSDLAAMGAKPLYYLISIVMPEETDSTSFKQLFDGMARLAKEFQMDLIGGDTVQGKELVISITVFGTVNPNKVRYRHQAKPGDLVFVTGTLGDARAGLELLFQAKPYNKKERYFVERHCLPKPRVNFALALDLVQRIALNDISDGIASELNEIAIASDVTIDIQFERLPIHQNLKEIAHKELENWVLYGGEDFELVGTVSPSEWKSMQLIAKQYELPLHMIGSVRSKIELQEYVYLHKEEKKLKLCPGGYNHFRR